MKQKYLLGMLLGGAMLTACSVDDDLTPARVAQDVNPSAPVFSVSLESDDPLTRAEWLGVEGNTKKYKLKFEEGDLLSLFNGIAITDGTNQNPNTATFTGMQNAIYSGEGNENGKMEFTTRAMVQAGNAIMVWPADTTFANTSDIKVTIPNNQVKADEEATPRVPATKELTPYISEFLNILNRNEEDNVTEPGTTLYPNIAKDSSVSGYGKKYDVILRRAAGVMLVNLKITNKPDLKAYGINDEVVVNKVTLTSTAENTFTTSVPVKVGDKLTNEKHSSWAYGSDLDVEQATGEKKMSTTDIENNVATFTMLPSNTNAEGAEIVLHTNYGDITIGSAADDNNNVWVNPLYTQGGTGDAEKQYLNTTEALALIKPRLYKAAKSGEFKDEKVGQYLEIDVNVDMNVHKVVMNGMHIIDGEHLKTALAVYQALGIKGEVEFKLDGDKNGEFKMTKEQWEAVDEQLNEINTESDYVRLTACKEDGPCKVIVLDNTKPDAVTEEVPQLQFTGDEIPVQLLGDWKYSAQDDVKKAKNLAGVSELVVCENATLALVAGEDSKIQVAEDGGLTEGITVEKKGTVNVNGDVELGINVTNHGTINVGNENTQNLQDKLRVDFGVTLTNCAATNTKTADNKANDYEQWVEGGRINNYSVLGIIKGTGQGEINNYGGVIDIRNEVAITLISKNSKEEKENLGDKANLADKEVGSIILGSIDGNKNNTTVGDGEKYQGFIKWTVKATNAQAKASHVGKVANYIIVEDATEIGQMTDGSTKDKDGWNLKYLEIQKSGLTVQKNLEVEALIVPSGTLSIPGDVTVKIEQAFYLKGIVTLSGNFDGNYKFVNYFGGVEKDEKNIVTH